MLKSRESNTAKINIKNKNLITNKCYINGAWIGSDKNFKVKNGLDVAGDAIFSSNVILGTTPISFDTQTDDTTSYLL